MWCDQGALVSHWKSVAAKEERTAERRAVKEREFTAEQLRRRGENANLIPISDEWKLKLAAAKGLSGAAAAADEE